MNFVRARRYPVAWILLVFVLLNGLLCSVGHGQMLAGERPSAILTADPDICGEQPHHASVDVKGQFGHASLMQLAMFDCLFAGKLVGTLVLVAGLGWLRRALDSAERLPPAPMPIAVRDAFPGLAPQAP